MEIVKFFRYSIKSANNMQKHVLISVLLLLSITSIGQNKPYHISGTVVKDNIAVKGLSVNIDISGNSKYISENYRTDDNGDFDIIINKSHIEGGKLSLFIRNNDTLVFHRKIDVLPQNYCDFEIIDIKPYLPIPNDPNKFDTIPSRNFSCYVYDATNTYIKLSKVFVNIIEDDNNIIFANNIGGGRFTANIKTKKNKLQILISKNGYYDTTYSYSFDENENKYYIRKITPKKRVLIHLYEKGSNAALEKVIAKIENINVTDTLPSNRIDTLIDSINNFVIITFSKKGYKDTTYYHYFDNNGIDIHLEKITNIIVYNVSNKRKNLKNVKLEIENYPKKFPPSDK